MRFLKMIIMAVAFAVSGQAHAVEFTQLTVNYDTGMGKAGIAAFRFKGLLDTDRSLAPTCRCGGSSISHFVFFEPSPSGSDRMTFGDLYLPGMSFTVEFPDFSFVTSGTHSSAPLGDGQPNATIVVQAGIVPEPATWAMMILGFGAVGGVMRRQSLRVGAARYLADGAA